MNKNKAILITVRTGSKRLPNKAMLEIGGRTTISHLIENVKKSKKADTIILCTTKLKEDDILCKIADESGINYFRGSVNDKLERWKGACKKFKVDFFVTADGDDLFCEPELIDLAFEQYERNNTDFIQGKDIICGSFTYGIKTDALNKVCDIKDTDDTEMMWVYFTDTDLFNVENLENVPKIYKRSDIRMTLDYEDDFKFFSTIINNLNNKESNENDHDDNYYLKHNSILNDKSLDFNLKDVLNYIDKNPEVKKINYYLHKKWSKNQQQKTKLVIKNEKHKQISGKRTKLHK